VCMKGDVRDVLEGWCWWLQFVQVRM
jgi:hypothetical protein